MTTAGLLRRWFGGWRGVPIDVRSPLPIDTARARLKAATAGRWSRSSLGGGRHVVGRVRDDGTVRLTAGSAVVRNSWRPTAHCVLEADGTGCRLIGILRAPLPVLVVSVIWLSLATVSVLIGLSATIGTLVTGHAHEAGAPAAFTGEAAGVLVLGGGLIGVGFAAGRRDGACLIEWIRKQLQVTARGRG